MSSLRIPEFHLGSINNKAQFSTLLLAIGLLLIDRGIL